MAFAAFSLCGGYIFAPKLKTALHYVTPKIGEKMESSIWLIIILN
jgi:hypothetical protein